MNWSGFSRECFFPFEVVMQRFCNLRAHRYQLPLYHHSFVEDAAHRFGLTASGRIGADTMRN